MKAENKEEKIIPVTGNLSCSWTDSQQWNGTPWLQRKSYGHCNDFCFLLWMCVGQPASWQLFCPLRALLNLEVAF